MYLLVYLFVDLLIYLFTWKTRKNWTVVETRPGPCGGGLENMVPGSIHPHVACWPQSVLRCFALPPTENHLSEFHSFFRYVIFRWVIFEIRCGPFHKLFRPKEVTQWLATTWLHKFKNTKYAKEINLYIVLKKLENL